MLTRRNFILGGTALATAGAFWWIYETSEDARSFEIERSDDEWRGQLTRSQFRVLRQHHTESPYSSSLNYEKRRGTFVCAGCELPLFSSDAKYDSRTGWPSFYQPLPNALGKRRDYALLIPRTEVHCRRCGGHLGHVFEDGPPPTGLRYCINGIAMTFTPSPEA